MMAGALKGGWKETAGSYPLWAQQGRGAGVLSRYGDSP
jgi:hypothetical protein